MAFFYEANANIILAQITEIHPLIKKGDSFSFVSPAGSYQKLIEWRKKDLHSCLYYKVPMGGLGNGELLEINDVKKCSLSNLSKLAYQLKDISMLQIQDIDLKKKPSFKLRIRIKEEETLKTYSFPFFSRENSMWSGIFLSDPSETHKSEPLVKGEICRYGCQQERGNQCQRCPSGQWTPYISLKCPASISGLCGLRECGGRDQKACLKMTAMKSELTCEEAKNFVFCSYGLEVDCLNTGEIICR